MLQFTLETPGILCLIRIVCRLRRRAAVLSVPLLAAIDRHHDDLAHFSLAHQSIHRRVQIPRSPTKCRMWSGGSECVLPVMNVKDWIAFLLVSLVGGRQINSDESVLLENIRIELAFKSDFSPAVQVHTKRIQNNKNAHRARMLNDMISVKTPPKNKADWPGIKAA